MPLGSRVLFGGRISHIMAFSLRSRAHKPVSSSLLLTGGLLLLALGAQADVYHPVADGETIASIASRYHVSTDALRQANGLSGSDTTPLSSMLLRVPGVDSGQMPLSAPQAPVAAPVVQTPAYSASRGSGTMARAVLDTVRDGDTWDSIAARFRAAGSDVSVEALRQRNGDSAYPVAGQKVVVPLGQLTYQSPPVYAPRIATNAPVGRSAAIVPTYTSSAQTTPNDSAAPAKTQSEPRNLGGGVYASGEFDLGSNVPVSTIREIPQSAPIFGSTSTVDTRRGSLASRGGYGEMARSAIGGEVRVLGQNEVVTAPQVGNNTTPDVTTQPVRPSGSQARVGQISAKGARIRRLPQDAAATLYSCAVGTRLAVLRQSGMWSAVLMSDRSTGWVPTKYLQMTEQTVDVSSQIVTTPGPGGAVGGAGARYASQSPMVAQALRWLGTPYLYGGTTRRGIDCSSLVQHAFAACGIQLPRTAATQARVGVAVPPSELRAGDRLYFSASGTRIDHTGLYMGNGLFVQASGSGRRVMVSNLFEPRNWNIFVGARR